MASSPSISEIHGPTNPSAAVIATLMLLVVSADFHVYERVGWRGGENVGFKHLGRLTLLQEIPWTSYQT